MNSLEEKHGTLNSYKKGCRCPECKLYKLPIHLADQTPPIAAEDPQPLGFGVAQPVEATIRSESRTI